MRRVLTLVMTASLGCASRSSLDHAARARDAALDGAADASVDSGTFDVASNADDAEPDAPPFETWSAEAGGAACSSRATACLDGLDFGPGRAVADVFTACAARVGAACGDLLLAFDAEGCLTEVREIRDFSPAFVECVARTVSLARWECAAGKSLRMLQACP
jgi:hypothetical protein